jgi:hypothetical protein
MAMNVSIYGQYVIKIPLNIENDLNVIESINLPLIHQAENEILTFVNEKNLNILNLYGIKYLILDKSETIDDYLILSGKQKKPLIVNSSWGEIIYQNYDFALFKTLKVKNEDLFDIGYEVIPLPDELSTFKNSRILPQPSKLSKFNNNIDQLVNEINVDSIRFYIQSLQDFQTRFLVVDNRDSVAHWLKNQFEKMGYSDLRLDSFQCYTSINMPPIVIDTLTLQANVVCTFPGTLYPDEVYIIGGHYDCMTRTNPWIFAPGADDNASGTAAVLEVARALKAINFQPEATIKFVAFAAEELMYFGDAGSRHFAQQANSSGMNIKLMINNDMISNTFQPLNNSRIGIGYYTGFEYYRELAKYLTNLYSVLTPENGGLNPGGDSEPFFQYGYPAIYLMETDFSPYYHTSGDTIENYNIDYCAEVIKASAATLIYTMVTPESVKDFIVADCGNGENLHLEWSPNTENDLAGYHLHLGLQSSVYDTIYTTIDTNFTLDNLIEGTEYYIGISAFDQDNNESMIVERTSTPNSIPLAPKNFADEPEMYAVQLHWSPNHELDLAGYNLYRSADPVGTFYQLNSNLIQDTSFLDQNVQSGLYYFYFVKALDTLLNESPPSDTLDSRSISLDQGILVIDETADGDGSLGHPTDEQVDSFYTAILNGFTFSQYDLIESGSIKLADLGPYSSVFWHGNDMGDLSHAIENQVALREYLEVGGNLFISSYMPTKTFGNNTTYPNQFSPGDFLYDYLKISAVDFNPPSRFNGAIPLMTGYNSIFVDTSKTFPQLNHHLIRIEGIHCTPDADAILSYHSDYPSSTSWGLMVGMPVGIEYLGTDFQMVLISFPFYYMKFNEAQLLVSHILVNKFNEVVNIESRTPEIPSEFYLSQNYPNPFNPSTTIEFDLPKTRKVTLKVFNILGEEVATLVSDRLSTGSYSYDWDASNLASGVYLYRLETGEYVETKKMILMK